MSELVTIVTRTCKRPDLLAKNIDSVFAQTDNDWKQIYLRDNMGRGLLYANGMFAQNKDRVHGQYVYILDDDDRLIISDFVAGIRAIVAASAPDVIMVKGNVRKHGILPHYWEQPPRSAHIGSFNFVVERELWKKHIEAFHLPDHGDFYFIDAVFKEPDITVAWWDKVVAESMRNGKRISEVNRGDERSGEFNSGNNR